MSDSHETPASSPRTAAKPGSSLPLPATASYHGTSNTHPAKSSVPRELRQLGRFKLLEKLGAGAFGQVFKAYDPQLQREVALKLAHASRLGDDADRDLFFREARAAAQLEHPHIVRVYETGVVDDAAYIVSALVKGESLAERVVRQRPTPAEAVRYVLHVADALHYAHLRGVFHRDVKPANVLVDEAGNASLADFGVARRLEGEDLRTVEGVCIGTPAYMSPEQARGESHRVDARSDLYSLGVVLWELLAGRRPFQGSGSESLQQLRLDPPPLRRHNKAAPADLEAICQKAMAYAPDERYPSVQHFAEDLQRWVENRPVLARRTPWPVRVRKWVRRRPLLAGGLAAAGVAIVAALAWQQTRPAYLDLRVAPAREGVQVIVAEREIALDEQGRALVELPPGRASVRITSPDHETHEQEIVLVRGRSQAAVTAVELKSRYGYVRADSDPAGATVELLDGAGKTVAKGSTPFNSPPVPAGDYVLRVTKDLYKPRDVNVTAPNGDRAAALPQVKLEPALATSQSYDRLVKAMDAMRTKVTCEFVGTPLRDVLADMSKQTGLTMILDLAALDDAGVTPEQPVTLSLKGVSLDAALRLALRPIGLSYLRTNESAEGFILQITSAEVANSQIFSVLHSTRDLGVARQADAEALARTIMSSIDPASWSSVGGACTIEAKQQIEALLVSQTFQVHANINSLLADMRAQRLAALRAQSQEDAAALDASPTYSALRRRRAALVAKATARFREVPLAEVLQSLSAGQPWQFKIDTRSIEDAGVTPATPVTVDRTDAPLGEVLDDMLQPLHLDYVMQGEEDDQLLVITTREYLGTSLTAVHFPVGDLLHPSGTLQQLVKEIERAVEPKSWDSAGGMATVRPAFSGQFLTVSQTFRTHGKVDDFLTLLRRQRDGKLENEPAFIEARRRKERLVAAVSELGGQTAVNPLRLGQPVIQVNLAKTEATDNDLAMLADGPEVENLSLDSTKISDAGLQHLAGLVELQSLSLAETSVTLNGDTPLPKLPKLHRLALVGTPVGDEGLVNLPDAAPTLRDLNLWKTRVTNDGLAHLLRCKQLQHLSLGFTGVTDTGMERLSGLRSLQSLGLNGCKFTDAGLAHLARIANLRQLYLSHSKTSDAGLEHLSKLTRLQVLWLDQTAVTDAGLAHLHGFKQLQFVNLTSTKATARGAAALREVLPQVQVQR